MTAEDKQELSEAVLRSRGYGFGPALAEIKPVVEQIVARHEFAALIAESMNQDYRKLICAIPECEVCRG